MKVSVEIFMVGIIAVSILAFVVHYYKKKINTLELKIAGLRVYKEQSEGLHKELEESKETIKNLENNVQSHKAKVSKLTKELEEHVEKDKRQNLDQRDLKVQASKAEGRVKELERELEEKVAKLESIDLTEIKDTVDRLKAEKESLVKDISQFKKDNGDLLYNIELLDSGFQSFEFSFQDVEEYEEAYQIAKEAQKELIKQGRAVNAQVAGLDTTPVFKGLSKVALQAFNREIDILTTKIKFSNYESSKERAIKVFEQINKNLSVLNCKIHESYLDAKMKEMTIAFELEQERQRIREEQAELLSQMREEESAREEAEKARLKAEEEEERYQIALEEAIRSVEGKSEEEKVGLMSEIEELKKKLSEAHQEKERATSMAQITKAGHVYIISNIGSFGDNIYKIGMTRRQEPMERVKELGDASVPFKFDVHAMVYSDNAPELESALHRYFDEKRVNKVNYRKEYFQVSLEQIQQACDELGYRVKLSKYAEAREYRETLHLVENLKAA